MAKGMGALVGGLRFAAEDPGHPALRIEADDHVRALVRRPQVALRVEADRVGEAPGIEVVADLPDEAAVRVEFQQLRRRRAVGGAGGVSPGKHHHMTVGADRHPGGFSEIDALRQLQGVGLGVEGDLRRPGGLGSRRRRQRREGEQAEGGEADPLHPPAWRSPRAGHLQSPLCGSSIGAASWPRTTSPRFSLENQKP